MLDLLRHPVFARLFGAQIIALLGSGLLTVALGLLAYDLAGAKAGMVLGMAYSIKMVAYVGLSPLAAAIFARYPRKTVLILADFTRAGVALTLPFITEVWQIYIAIFVLQAASATFTPAFQATIPDILPDEAQYTRALSLSRLAYDIENVVSPMIAGVLLVFVSFHWLFAGTTVGFVCSALLIMSVSIGSSSARPGRPFTYRLTQGIRIYLATPRLRGLLSLNLSAAAIGAFVIVNSVVIVRSTFGLGESGLALALGAFGAGSMIAALSLPGLLENMSDRLFMRAASGVLVALAFAAGIAWNSIGIGWAGLLGLWALFGLSYSATLTPSGRLLRRSAHAEDRGMVFTAHFALSHLCWLIAYPLAGWTFATFGAGSGLIAMASLGLLGLVLARVNWPPETSGPVAHSHPDLAPDHPHLREGGVRHIHPIIIDDEHRHWPVQDQD